MAGARYTIIKGEYHIFYPEKPKNGPEPDGDTIKFKADDPSLVEGLKQFGRQGPAFNRNKMVNVRFEAIDALETHFAQSHQAIEPAYEAREHMLAGVGFENVVFWDDLPDKVKAVEEHPLRGYVLANGLDVHGRIIGFVYPDEGEGEDGEPVRLSVPKMKESINLQLLSSGLAYAAIYTSLPNELILAVREEAKQVRASGTGMFADEDLNTTESAMIASVDDLESMIMWPKLFRRLVRFFGAGHTDLAKLDEWLREDVRNRDDRLLLPGGELGNLHDMIAVEGGTLKLVYEPETVVILPDDA